MKRTVDFDKGSRDAARLLLSAPEEYGADMAERARTVMPGVWASRGAACARWLKCPWWFEPETGMALTI